VAPFVLAPFDLALTHVTYGILYRSCGTAVFTSRERPVQPLDAGAAGPPGPFGRTGPGLGRVANGAGPCHSPGVGVGVGVGVGLIRSAC
jgi:hypothetical protein